MNMIAGSLKRFRDKLGYSQEGIAGSVGMKQTTWSGWEKNPPDALEWLVLLSEKHGVSVDFMLGLTDDPMRQFGRGSELSEHGLQAFSALKDMSPAQQGALLEMTKILKDLEERIRAATTAEMMAVAAQYIEQHFGVQAVEELYQAVDLLRRTGNDSALTDWFARFLRKDESDDSKE